MKNFDVAIVGAGMVGLTTALAIRNLTDLSVAIIDNQPPQPLTEEPELRVSAISHASQRIFSNLGAWLGMTQKRLQAYSKMHVWDSNGYGKLAFDADALPEKSDSLGWIIENSVIRNSLYERAQQDAGIEIIEHRISQIAQGESEVFLQFEAQAPVIAKLIVGADGANSWLRQQIDMPLTFRDYDHHALVATVELEHGHDNTAWQVFLDDGPLAFLPLYQENLCSIVWSQSPQTIDELCQIDELEFGKRITAATDGKFGDVKLCSERGRYPLTMRLARDFVQDSVVLIGDAAHTIHPLAGQGVNLGLLDAVALAQTLADKNFGQSSALNKRLLAQFARWRKSDATDMIAAMEAIKQTFTPQHPAIKLVRGLGMSVLNEVSPVKNLLAGYALGKRDNLPELAK